MVETSFLDGVISSINIPNYVDSKANIGSDFVVKTVIKFITHPNYKHRTTALITYDASNDCLKVEYSGKYSAKFEHDFMNNETKFNVGKNGVSPEAKEELTKKAGMIFENIKNYIKTTKINN